MDTLCSSSSAVKRRQFYQQKKLEFLNFVRDNTERKLAAIDASIDTLKKQITRDENSILEN